MGLRGEVTSCPAGQQVPLQETALTKSNVNKVFSLAIEASPPDWPADLILKLRREAWERRLDLDQHPR